MASGVPPHWGNGTWSVGGVDFDVSSVLESARTTTGKLSILVLAPSIACLVWFWVAYQTSPLRKYPGPFLAGSNYKSFTCRMVNEMLIGCTRIHQSLEIVAGRIRRLCPSHEKTTREVRAGCSNWTESLGPRLAGAVEGCLQHGWKMDEGQHSRVHVFRVKRTDNECVTSM